jgi:signal transduction histidine kinase/ActR/RegA family two-component response regulator
MEMDRLQIIPLFTGSVLTLMGVTVGIGWLWQLPNLVQILPGLAAMAAPTAICFSLAGLALVLCTMNPRMQSIAKLCGAMIVGIALFNLLILLSGADLDIWKSAHTWFNQASGIYVRMSLSTSIAFLLGGTGLCLSDGWRYANLLRKLFSFSVFIVGVLALLGYLLSLEQLYEWYVFIHMAAHTAIGMILLGVGLCFTGKNIRSIFQFDDGGVVAIAVAVLLGTSLSVGISGWITEQHHLVRVLGDGLQLAQHARAAQIATILQLRSTRAAIVANRPNLLKSLRVLNTKTDSTDTRNTAVEVLRSFEPFGFSGIVIYGVDGRELVRNGTLIENAQLTAFMSERTSNLVWRDGFYLRRLMPVHDNLGELGTIVTEQPLPELNTAVLGDGELGGGDELLLCTAQQQAVHCFPTRRDSQPYVLPDLSADRKILADSALRNETAVKTVHDFHNRTVVAAFGPVGNYGLITILKAGTQTLYKPMKQQFVHTIALLLVLITLGIVLIYTRVRPLIAALRLSEHGLQSALKASGSHVWNLDLRTEYLIPSQSFLQHLGYSEAPYSFDLMSWRKWVVDKNVPGKTGANTDWLTLLADPGIEVKIANSKGDYRWFLFRGDVVDRDLRGAPLRARGTATDVTERKKMEQQLIAARIAADDASHAKSLFLSSMSHELRTPLNGVLGYVQMLQDNPATSSEQQRQLDAIESCGQHLLSLINDVLDLSKIESGGIEIEDTNCNLYDLLESVSDIVRQRAQSKGLQYNLEIDKTVPPFVRIDDVKLRQILVNLLGNAIKFTEHGSVILRVFTRMANRELLFQVRDTGIGIPPEKQQEIFQPFHQIGRSAGGTGLGLSISQRLCEAMGGMLLVQSSIGEGSCFSVNLPLVLGEAMKTTEPLHATHPIIDIGGQNITILVADDNPINRQVLASMLRANGLATSEVENGQEAIAALRTQHYALVLMDVRMPVMDGLTATREIRADPTLRDTKIIVVSASVSTATIKEMLAAGCDDFIKKPVRVRELLEKVARHLQLPLREPQPNQNAHLR